MKKKMKKFAEGGFSKEQEDWLGGADRTDPFILARMRAAVPDAVKSMEQVQDEQEGYESKYREPKAVEKTVVKTKVTPTSSFKSISSKDEEGNKLPADVKKPYIAIPKNAAGMQQFRSDAVSPAERLWKSLTETKSQRSKAAGMKKGGSVSSASKRADGCAVKGKTKGRMV
jgi:hypothetical protein